MRGVGELASEAIARGTYRPVPATELPQPLDYCGCVKLPGCWGNDGFHFRRYGKPDLEREIDNSLAKLPQGSTDRERELVEKTTRDRYAAYLGTHVAYEPCPSFRAALLRQISERRQATGGNGRGILGGGL